MKLSIEIDWPEKLLWSNGQRGGYRAYNTAVGSARQGTQWLARVAVQRAGVKPTLELLGGEPVPVLLVVSPKRHWQRPDRQNCASVIKPHIDGICDAIGIDDRYFDAARVQFDDSGGRWMRIEIGVDEVQA